MMASGSGTVPRMIASGGLEDRALAGSRTVRP